MGVSDQHNDLLDRIIAMHERAQKAERRANHAEARIDRALEYLHDCPDPDPLMTTFYLSS